MPSPSSLKSTVEKLISDGSRLLQEKSSALQRAQSKASSTQGALTACTQLLGQQQAEADALRAKISSTLARLNEEVGAQMVTRLNSHTTILLQFNWIVLTEGAKFSELNVKI